MIESTTDPITAYPDLPRELLAYLLDVAGACDRLSPRPLLGDAATPSPGQIAELYAGGFIDLPESGQARLTAGFEQIADVLRAPQSSIAFKAWGGESGAECSIQYPGEIRAGSGVVLNQVGNRYRISAFVDDHALLDLLRPFLPPPNQRKAPEFEAHLEAGAALVLLALADLQSGRRADAPKQGIEIDAITEYLEGDWTALEASQLLTYAIAVGRIPSPPDRQDVIQCLGALAKDRLIVAEEKGHFLLAPSLQPLVTLSSQCGAGLGWQRVSLTDRGELLMSNRKFLFGEPPLIMALAPTVDGFVHLECLDGKSVSEFVLNEVCTPHVGSELRDQSPHESEAETPQSPARELIKALTGHGHARKSKASTKSPKSLKQARIKIGAMLAVLAIGLVIWNWPKGNSDPYTSPPSSPASSAAAAPRAVIGAPRFEHDIVYNNRTGLRISFRLDAFNLHNQQVLVMANFYLSDGQPLKDFDNAYRSQAGNVMTRDVVIAPSTVAKWQTFRLYIPYPQLHLAPGKVHSLLYDIEVWGGPAGGQKLLSRSPKYRFTVNW